MAESNTEWRALWRTEGNIEYIREVNSKWIDCITDNRREFKVDWITSVGQMGYIPNKGLNKGQCFEIIYKK